jgi:hypothetical protein
METLNQTNWLIGGQDGAANRLGLPRTTLIYEMRKLGIETRRSLGASPIRQLADGQCHAAANCRGDAASPGALLDSGVARFNRDARRKEYRRTR